MKKILITLTIIIFNIFLLWTSIVAPALILASSKAFYKGEFRDNGIYAIRDENGNESRKIIRYVGGEHGKRATFSDKQLDEIVDHIIGYLFGDVQDFALVMNNVYIVDEGYCDGISVFGESAVSHMEDVKELIRLVSYSLIFSVLFIVAAIVVFIFKAKDFREKLFTVSRGFFLTIAFFAAAFVMYSYFTATPEIPFALNAWTNLHYLIFPFQPEKIAGSALYDALTCMLTTELFISAVFIILTVVILVTVFWLTVTYFLKKSSQKIPK